MMEQPQGRKKEPERLSAVLKNPSADWAEIRAAMKAQGRGCTNLAIMTTLSSAGGGSDDKKVGSSSPQSKSYKNDATAGNEEVNERQKSDFSGGDDKLMPLGENRRASLTSEDSSKKNNQSSSAPRRRISRQSSRRRTGVRRQELMRNSRRMMMLKSSMNTSMRHGSLRSITLESLGESSGSHNNSSGDFNKSSFQDSINVMDFGISQRGMRLALLCDENHRSHVSLDDSALDDLREEFDEQMGSLSKRDLLVSWRHDSRISDLDASTKSESDLDDFVDSSGFMDWPGEEGEDESGSIAIDYSEDYDNLASLQEESLKEVQQEGEEWNIEDYEFNDDSGAERRQSSKNSMSWAVAKTIETFQSIRQSSRTESSSSLEDLDLQKIKETLPTIMAKNKQLSNTSLEGETVKKKRTSLFSMFQENIEDEVVHSQKEADNANAMAEKAQRRKSRGEVIWAKNSCIPGSSEQYKNLYDPEPKMQQKKSWKIFEGMKKD